jgi:Peptide N-acetyl-beta-D-glucosaminyl asparaginase amidase A
MTAVIYSGEFLPSIWRPMLSYGAFDSPTYYIDITPFVPSLCDGKPHAFTLDVAGMGANFSTNQNWIISGNLQVCIFNINPTQSSYILSQLLLDDTDEATTGSLTIYEAAPFVSPSTVGSVAGVAPNVSVTTSANRTIHIQGHLTTGSGKTTTTIWQQQLSVMSSFRYPNSCADIRCSPSLPMQRSTPRLCRTSVGR